MKVIGTIWKAALAIATIPAGLLAYCVGFVLALIVGSFRHGWDDA